VVVISTRLRFRRDIRVDWNWKSIRRGILVARDWAIRKWITRLWMESIVPRKC
jgi:hypothetical protein